MSGEKTVIIHVGGEKTGTTAIQESLYWSERRLRKAYGVIYPRKVPLNAHTNHKPIPAAFLPPNKIDFVPGEYRQTLDQIENGLRALADRGRAIVLSAEHFSSRLDPEKISALRSLIARALPAHRARIIFYVRNQVSLYGAAISQHIKATGFSPLTPERVSPDGPFFNHHILASNWANVFGRDNLTIVNYHAGDAISAFYKLLGVDPDDRRLYRPPRPLNVSLTRCQAQILIEINRMFGASNPSDHDFMWIRNRVQRGMIWRLQHASLPHTPMEYLLSPADRLTLREKFRASNDRLQADFALDFNLNDFGGNVETADDLAAAEAERQAAERELKRWRGVIGGTLSARDQARAAAVRLRRVLVAEQLRELLRSLTAPRAIWDELTGWL